MFNHEPEKASCRVTIFAGEAPQKGFYGYGHYHETYVKQAGQWRIKKTELTRLRVDPF